MILVSFLSHSPTSILSRASSVLYSQPLPCMWSSSAISTLFSWVMSVLAAFCDTFVYWQKLKITFDEVGVQLVFSEVTDFNDLTRWQSLSVCMYYKLYHRSLNRGETDRKRKREGDALQLFIKMQLGVPDLHIWSLWPRLNSHHFTFLICILTTAPITNIFREG